MQSNVQRVKKRLLNKITLEKQRQSALVLAKFAVDLLDLLQRYLPDKTGERAKWNFEKAHCILHKVHKIVLWGYG